MEKIINGMKQRRANANVLKEMVEASGDCEKAPFYEGYVEACDAVIEEMESVVAKLTERATENCNMSNIKYCAYCGSKDIERLENKDRYYYCNKCNDSFFV